MESSIGWDSLSPLVDNTDNTGRSSANGTEEVQQMFMYKLGTGIDETGLIPRGHYNTVSDLVRALNRCMTKEAQTRITFFYVANKRKWKSIFQKEDTFGDIDTLGFEQDTLIKKETLSIYVADVNGGFSTNYICTCIHRHHGCTICW